MSHPKSNIYDNQSIDFIEALKHQSRIQDIDQSGIIIHNYKKEKYPFSDIIIKLLIDRGYLKNYIPLESIHQNLLSNDMEVDKNQINNIVKSFYDTNLEMSILYKKFMEDEVVPIIGKTCYFQKTPTNRFSFPFSTGMNERDFHNDIMLGHPPQEINVWIPFTDASKSLSFKILPLSFSLELLKIYNYNLVNLHRAIWQDDELFKKIQNKSTFVKINTGQILLFDSRCIHASTLNKSNFTRVSMDVRVIPKNDYLNLPIKYQGTGRMQSNFAPGDYYHEHALNAR